RTRSSRCSCMRVFYSPLRPPRGSTLFPYTTLFRSSEGDAMVEFDDTFRQHLRELFVWRRDVRRFRADPLPDGAIDRLIETACLRSEEHTSELQSRGHLVCRLLLEKKNIQFRSKPWR